MSDEESEGDEDAAGPGDSGGEDDDMQSESEATSVDDEEEEDLATKQHTEHDQENIDNTPTTLQKTREDDRQKGKAITRQIVCQDVRSMHNPCSQRSTGCMGLLARCSYTSTKGCYLLQQATNGEH